MAAGRVDVVVFDLDETLIVEEPAAVAAFAATADFAAQQRELDAGELAIGARSRARELWHASDNHPFCDRIGVSSWEGLWCRFEGDAPELRLLREWAPWYRSEAWRVALADQGIDDSHLAQQLGDLFGIERRARHQVFSDSDDVLTELATSHRLALITNGAPCLQREKLAASGLGHHFELVVVSGEWGVAKPDPSIFAHALERLGADPADAVMVGDSLVKDIDGAVGAGLSAVWVNRLRQPRPAERAGLLEIHALSELPAQLS